MSVIYKYPFPITDFFMLDLPRGAAFLHAEVQDGVPCMWCLVDPTAEQETRSFRVIGTGHPIANLALLTHLRTFLNAPFVWHLFEEKST